MTVYEGALFDQVSDLARSEERPFVTSWSGYERGRLIRITRRLPLIKRGAFRQLLDECRDFANSYVPLPPEEAVVVVAEESPTEEDPMAAAWPADLKTKVADLVGPACVAQLKELPSITEDRIVLAD